MYLEHACDLCGGCDGGGGSGRLAVGVDRLHVRRWERKPIVRACDDQIWQHSVLSEESWHPIGCCHQPSDRPSSGPGCLRPPPCARGSDTATSLTGWRKPADRTIPRERQGLSHWRGPMPGTFLGEQKHRCRAAQWVTGERPPASHFARRARRIHFGSVAGCLPGPKDCRGAARAGFPANERRCSAGTLSALFAAPFPHAVSEGCAKGCRGGWLSRGSREVAHAQYAALPLRRLITRQSGVGSGFSGN